jgi:hypothetical protein
MKVSTLELYIFIIIIINAFFESILMFIFDTDIYSFSKLNQSLTNFIKIYYNIANFLLIFISLYLLFVKNIMSPIAVLICAILLFKGCMHFFVALDLYKYLNLSPKNEKKLLKFHNHEAIITSVINIILSSILLYKIF